MRKSFDGLCGLVSGQLDRIPTSGEVFVFVNRRRDRLKLLRWERGGFVLYYKRLESGTIELPNISRNKNSHTLQWSDLVMMIEGISLANIQRRKRYVINTH